MFILRGGGGGSVFINRKSLHDYAFLISSDAIFVNKGTQHLIDLARGAFLA